MFPDEFTIVAGAAKRNDPKIKDLVFIRDKSVKYPLYKAKIDLGEPSDRLKRKLAAREAKDSIVVSFCKYLRRTALKVFRRRGDSS